ncbi:MAG: aldehyde dehydrogenase family protein [Frankiaceae bacterium]
MTAGVAAAVAATSFPVVDPRTGEVLERVAMLPAGEVARVVSTAVAANERWAGTPLAERCALVERLADELAADVEVVARAFSREHGKTLIEARTELERATDALRWSARAALEVARAAALPDRDGLVRSVTVEPGGPVLAIVPWNFPAVVLARKLGPALVMGCPVIVKAAEQAPFVSAAFARAAGRAGLPPGVVQVVLADPAVTQELVRRRELGHVTFTGSTRVGRIVAALAAEALTPCTLELGGHAPAIVLADADLDVAVTRLAAAKFGSAGQSCGAPSRFLVERPVHDGLVARLIAAAPALEPAARGATGEWVMGPLNNERRRVEVHALVTDAVERGARLRCGGEVPAGSGWYYPATVLTEVPLDARVLVEEPFGPVAPVLAFDEIDDAVRVANSTDYALAAYVFGGADRAAAIAARLDAGSVSINAAPGAAPDAPLGGRRASGYGYEGGEQGLLALGRLKIIQAAVES